MCLHNLFASLSVHCYVLLPAVFLNIHKVSPHHVAFRPDCCFITLHYCCFPGAEHGSPHADGWEQMPDGEKSGMKSGWVTGAPRHSADILTGAGGRESSAPFQWPCQRCTPFPNAQLETNQGEVLKSSTFVVSFRKLLFFPLHSPASSSSSSSTFSLPSIAAPIFSPYVSSAVVFLFFFTSATISPCQQCQPGPCAAEKIEPQIEQSISVRIHQCQTTPSLAVCIEHARTHA